MYVFTNNYSLGGTILSGLVGAYIGYKIGRAKPQKKGFSTEKKIGRKIKGAFSKKKFANGGGIYGEPINDWFIMSKSEVKEFLKEGYVDIDTDERQDWTKIAESDKIVYYGYPFEFEGDFNDTNLNYWAVLKSSGKGGSWIGHEEFSPLDYEHKTKKLTYKHPELDSIMRKVSYAEGGSIGFKGLSAKVAKRYAGKKVAPKYQGEYGKRYSKSEAKEVGDKVAGKVYWQQKGRKMAEGGKILQEISTHKAVKKGDKIYIYIKGMPIENAEDKRLAKKYPHWYEDELIRTIPAENEDDLFYIFENLQEENRINLSGYARGGGVDEKITKSRLKAKLYEPTGDFFIEDKGNKWFIHFTPKDASKNSSNLSDLNAKSIGNGYYGSAYSVDKVITHKYDEGGNVKEGNKYEVTLRNDKHYGEVGVSLHGWSLDNRGTYYLTLQFPNGSTSTYGQGEVKNYGKRYSNGGGVEKPKYKYYVEWLEDGMLQSEIYNEDEYEGAKELYYQIKYDLFDSQYKRPQIFISDYETGEVVFGDAFEYARGGGVESITPALNEKVMKRSLEIYHKNGGKTIGDFVEANNKAIKEFGYNPQQYHKIMSEIGSEYEDDDYFAKGGEVDEVITINIEGYPYYLKKMGDTTHFKLANSKEGIDMVIGSHIGQHKGEEYYSDVASWLKGGKSPNGKSYNSYYYAKGGGVSGIDDLIRG
jgi:hypothetical protein